MDRHRTAGQPVSCAGAGAVPGVRRRPSTGTLLDVARIVGASVARVVLLAAICLLGWGAAPAALGWTPTTVMTGSMEPRIHPGDIVVARPVAPAALSVGQVVLVDDPDHAGRLRLHRFVAAAADGRLVLRGDANQNDDSTHVATSAVHGVGFIRVPYVGMPVVWLAERRMVALSLLTAALMLLVAATRLDRGLRGAAARARVADEDRGASPDQEGVDEGPSTTTGKGAPQTVAGHPGRRRVLVGAGTALALLALTGSGLLGLRSAAGATFTAPAKNPLSSLAASSTFSCLDPTVSDSPYFYYAFNEVSGSTATDASGNARPGTVGGGTSRVSGSCADNDSPALGLGGGGTVSTATRVTAAPTTMSMELWIRTSTTTGGVLMDFGSSQTGSSTATDRILYLTNAGKVAFGVYTSLFGEQVATSTSSYNDDQWHHVVATLAGTTMQLYVDGTRVAQKTTYLTARSNAGYWRVGADAITSSWSGAPSSASFEGDVDDAAAYTTALSSTRVSAHYAAGR